MTFGDMLRFDVGPARAGWYTLGLVVAAVVPLLIATRTQLRVGDARVDARAGVVRARVVADAHLADAARARAPRACSCPRRSGSAIAAGHRRERAARRHAARRTSAGARSRPSPRRSGSRCRCSRSRPTPRRVAGSSRATTGRPRCRGWATRRPRAGSACCGSATRRAAGRQQGGRRDGSRRIGFGLTRDGPGDARALVGRARARRRRHARTRALLAARAGDTAAARAPARADRRPLRGGREPDRRRVTAPSSPVDPALADALTRQLDLSISRLDTARSSTRTTRGSRAEQSSRRAPT